MPPSRQGGRFLGEVQPGPYYRFTCPDLGWTLSLMVCRCTARFVAQTTKCKGGLAPDVVGGERCLAAVSFLSLSGGPGGLWGGGSRFQAGARVLDRTGTDKGWYSRYSQPQGQQCNCSPWGEFRGWAAAGSFFVHTAARLFSANGRKGIICRRTEPSLAARLATGK